MSLPSGPMWAAVLGVGLCLAVERAHATWEWWKDFRRIREIRARQARQPWSKEPAKRYREARAKRDP